MKFKNMNEAIYNKNVIEFVTVCGEYCSFIENAASLKKEEFISKSAGILPLLYLKASLIPKPEYQLSGENESFVTEADYAFLRTNIENLLEDDDLFIELPVLIEQGQGLNETAALSELFADIYQDTMNFISNYRIGNEEVMNDSLSECINNFEDFWGSRLLILVTTLHQIKYKNDLNYI